MKRMKVYGALIIVSALLVVIGLSVDSFLDVKHKTDEQLQIILHPDLPRVRLESKTIANLFAPKTKSVRWFSDVSQMNSIRRVPGGLLAGTGGGLALYDQNGQTSRAGRPTGLPFTSVIGLFEKSGRIHVFGQEGIVILKDDFPASYSGESLTFPTSNPSTITIAALFEDRLFFVNSDGTFYELADRAVIELGKTKLDYVSAMAAFDDRFIVGTVKGELFEVMFYGGRSRVTKIEFPESIGKVRSMTHLDSDLLIACDRGLFTLTGKILTQRFSGKIVTSVVLAGNEIYFGTYEGELRKLDQKDPVAQFENPIRSLTFAENRILIGTQPTGFWFDPSDKSRESFRVESSKPNFRLNENYVTALAFDGAMVLVGGLNSGVCRLDPASGKTQPFGPEIPGVSAIEKTANGHWLIGATNGIYELGKDGSLVKRQTRKEGLIHNNVTALLVDKDRVYAATAAGLSKIKDDSILSIYAFHGLVNNHLYTLAKGRAGVGVGTLGGLCEVGGKDGLTVHQCWTEKQGMPHPWVTALLSWKGGWLVGTYGGGVSSIGKQGDLVQLNGFQNTSVNLNAGAVGKNAAFFGTLKKGLLYTNDGKNLQAVKGELPSLNVTSVSLNDSRIAIGTDAGLVVADLDLMDATW